MPQPQQAPCVAGLALPQAEPAAEELGELQGSARGGGAGRQLRGVRQGVVAGPAPPSRPAAVRSTPRAAAEQQRLAHVAATRARRHHFVSYPATVPEWGRSKRAVRSSFLDAMLAELEQRGAADAVVVRE